MHWLSLWHEILVWHVLSGQKLDGDVLDVSTLRITKVQGNVTRQYVLLKIFGKTTISPEILRVLLVSSQNIDKHGTGQHTESISKSAVLALCPMQRIAVVRKSSSYNYKWYFWYPENLQPSHLWWSQGNATLENVWRIGPWVWAAAYS